MVVGQMLVFRSQSILSVFDTTLYLLTKAAVERVSAEVEFCAFIGNISIIVGKKLQLITHNLRLPSYNRV